MNPAQTPTPAQRPDRDTHNTNETDEPRRNRETLTTESKVPHILGVVFSRYYNIQNHFFNKINDLHTYIHTTP